MNWLLRDVMESLAMPIIANFCLAIMNFWLFWANADGVDWWHLIASLANITCCGYLSGARTRIKYYKGEG